MASSTASPTILAAKTSSTRSSLLPPPATASVSISFERSRSGAPLFGHGLRLTAQCSSICPPRDASRIDRDLRTRTTAATGKPTVLVSEKLGEAGLAILREFANVDCSYNLTPEELCSKISLCDALIVRSGTKVTREVFDAAGGRLKVVGRAGVGIDNVDLQAATENGCLVVNAPTANTVAAAEHGIALLAAMARNVAQADASMKAGELSPPSPSLALSQRPNMFVSFQLSACGSLSDARDPDLRAIF